MSTGYFKLIDTIKTELSSYALVNSITMGNGDEVDLNKQTIFPLVHIIVIDATPNRNIVTFNLKIFFLDIVDINKEQAENNVDYVHNNMYNVALRLYESLYRGNLWDNGLEVSSVRFTAVERAYENYLAGWQMDLSIMIPNHMSIC
jgi:hypothetical protein